MSLNSCSFIGNLGQDPVIKNLPNGEKVANFSIACSEKWKDKNSGEQKTKTQWIPVVAFGKIADIVSKYVKKGSSIYVTGQFQTRDYVDKEGIKKYITEIVLNGFNAKLLLLDSKSDGKPKEDKAWGEVEKAFDKNEAKKTEEFLEYESEEVPF